MEIESNTRCSFEVAKTISPLNSVYRRTYDEIAEASDREVLVTNMC